MKKRTKNSVKLGLGLIVIGVIFLIAAAISAAAVFGVFLTLLLIMVYGLVWVLSLIYPKHEMYFWFIHGSIFAFSISILGYPVAGIVAFLLFVIFNMYVEIQDYNEKVNS